MNFKINDDRLVKYLQEGGPMPEEAAPAEPAAAPEQGGSPEEQIMMACQEALQTQNCELALQVCQAILQMMGGGQPAPAAPEGAEPVYRRGGILKRYQRKA